MWKRTKEMKLFTFHKRPYQINQLLKDIFHYLEIDVDARGNKLSSCKVTDQYLKKQKSY